MKLAFSLIYSVSTVTLLLLSGCASTPKPTVVKVSINAQPGLNPDSHGRPSPVVMKLYELKSVTAFDGADFFSVFDNEQKTLGPDLLNSEVFQLRPGEKLKLERPLQPDARYVGIVVAFRDLEHSQWRAALVIPPKKKIKRIVVQLEASKIRIMGEQQCLLCILASQESLQVNSLKELQKSQTKRTQDIQLALHPITVITKNGLE